MIDSIVTLIRTKPDYGQPATQLGGLAIRIFHCIGCYTWLCVSDFGFSKFPIPGLHLFRFVTEFFISVLPMVFLQYWLSFRLKNLITSLGIGLGGLMIGLLLKSWEYIIYLQYAAPFQILNYIEGVFSLPYYLLNAVYAVLFVMLSYKDLTKRFRG